ncbi:MAG TPA: BON domain-containing protein, partial [Actinomycetota bacterium]|nr:BON domain-containing protein [Actinomycetota bacterium]
MAQRREDFDAPRVSGDVPEAPQAALLVREAIDGSEDIDARRIDVVARGNDVVLRGWVASHEEALRAPS